MTKIRKCVYDPPLEVPVQVLGAAIATAGMLIGLVLPNLIFMILAFFVGMFIFVNAPHNYGDAP